MTPAEFDAAFPDVATVAADPAKVRFLLAIVRAAREDVNALAFALNGLRFSLQLPERLNRL